MLYTAGYESELTGRLELVSDGESLVGCWFEGGRYGNHGLGDDMEPADGLPVFEQARAWLDRYGAGMRPAPGELPLAARGSSFQKRVWKLLTEIPYGRTATYGEIARRIAAETGAGGSARAVGGAVGRNPLCIIVPCHRVVGANGSLTGFGGGLATKIKLLEHEQVDMSALHAPKKAPAWDTSI